MENATAPARELAVSPALPLGAKSFEVFWFIVSWKIHHDGDTPSVSQIGAACGISSTSHARYHIERLIAAGLLVKRERYHGGLKVIGGEWNYRGKEGAK